MYPFLSPYRLRDTTGPTGETDRSDGTRSPGQAPAGKEVNTAPLDWYNNEDAGDLRMMGDADASAEGLVRRSYSDEEEDFEVMRPLSADEAARDGPCGMCDEEDDLVLFMPDTLREEVLCRDCAESSLSYRSSGPEFPSYD